MRETEETKEPHHQFSFLVVLVVTLTIESKVPLFSYDPDMERVCAAKNTAVREKITKLDLVVKRVRDVFAASSRGDLVEIPVDQIGLERTVRAFVRNLR